MSFGNGTAVEMCICYEGTKDFSNVGVRGVRPVELKSEYECNQRPVSTFPGHTSP